MSDLWNPPRAFRGGMKSGNSVYRPQLPYEATTSVGPQKAGTDFLQVGVRSRRTVTSTEERVPLFLAELAGEN
jgi:hypothetical protein